MKQFFLALVFFLLTQSPGFAQNFPQYGLVTQEELEMKECAFDKHANAVVLIDEAYSDYDDQRRLVTYHHVKLKILNEKGFNEASVIIPYWIQDDFETIDQVEGITINPTQNLQVDKVNLQRKSVFTQKENDRIGKVVFTFPAVKAGSIINYKYRSTMKHYGGLEEWVFQKKLPVIKSKYTLVILPNMEFAYRVQKTAEFPLEMKADKSVGSVFFAMQNIPGLEDEAFMDSRNDYLQKVTFQLSGYAMGSQNSKKYMTSWEEATRELIIMKEFGGQLGKNIPGTDDFIAQVKAMISPEVKMKAVFNFVRSNMNWNGLYSKYSSDGVKEAWQKKTGNRGDINLILANLLKEASIEAYPMLVSERFHGNVDATYPFLDQFNAVFVYANINGKKYYLDATNKTIPPHLTPVEILNTTAFVVNRKAGGLIQISDEAGKYTESITADLTLASDAVLSGKVNVASYDYARIKKLNEFKTDKNGFLNSYFKIEDNVADPASLVVENLTNDSLAFLQSAQFTTTLNTAGDFIFMPLNIFSGFEGNPFTSENRFSNINLGYGRLINVTLNLKLPSNYEVDGLPKSIKITNPDKDILFSRQLLHDKAANSVSCVLVFDFKKSLYDKEMYPTVKEIYQMIVKQLAQPLVLKRKS